MAKTAVLFGILLVLVGVVGYALGGEHKSLTAFIPAYEGAILLVLGAIVLAKPGARKHAMHFAAMVGVLGVIAPLGRLVPKLMKGELPPTLTLVCLLLMAGLSAVFVFLCVKSFIAAKREREAAGLPVGAPRG